MGSERLRELQKTIKQIVWDKWISETQGASNAAINKIVVFMKNGVPNGMIPPASGIVQEGEPKSPKEIRIDPIALQPNGYSLPVPYGSCLQNLQHPSEILLTEEMQKSFGDFASFTAYIHQLNIQQRGKLFDVVTRIPHAMRTEQEAKGVCLLALLCGQLSENTAGEIFQLMRSSKRKLAATNIAELVSEVDALTVIEQVDEEGSSQVIGEVTEYLWAALESSQMCMTEMNAIWIVSGEHSPQDIGEEPLRIDEAASALLELAETTTPLPAPPSSPSPLHRTARAG